MKGVGSKGLCGVLGKVEVSIGKNTCKAKRKVEGFTDPENIAMAKAQLKDKQKQLREFIEQTNADEGAEVLRRDSGREKTYEGETVNHVEPNYAKQFEPFNADHIPSTATITPEIVEEELNKSEVGREALQYIKDTEIQPSLFTNRNGIQTEGNNGEIVLRYMLIIFKVRL